MTIISLKKSIYVHGSILLILLSVFLYRNSDYINDNNRSISSTDQTIHIVFDLDWTLIYPLNGEIREISNKSFGFYKDELYRLADWSTEMITNLANTDNIKISFFSGGPNDRNKHLLQNFFLNDGSGRSYFDITHKLLSKEDLTTVRKENLDKIDFTEKFKKDLRKVSSNTNNVILIDDNFRFALSKKMRKNIIWLGHQYIHFEKYSETVKQNVIHYDKKYIPKHFINWKYNKNKLGLVWVALNLAIKDYKSSNNDLPFNKIVQEKVLNLSFVANYPNQKDLTYLEILHDLNPEKFDKFWGKDCTFNIMNFL